MSSDKMGNVDPQGISELGNGLMELISEEDCSTIQHLGVGLVEMRDWRIIQELSEGMKLQGWWKVWSHRGREQVDLRDSR